MPRWSPVDIKNLLHLYYSPEPLDHDDDAYANIIGSGLVVCDMQADPSRLVLSDHGRAFIAFLLDMPIPERQWHMPRVEHKR
jgi:hypothetical protein